MPDILILAGSGKESDLTLREGVKNKAFITIHGKAMLERILDAMVKVPGAGRIAVVGPPEQLMPYCRSHNILPVPEKGGIPDNIRAGMQILQPRGHFIISTADIAFITPAAVEGFVEQCRPYDRDAYYPIVAREANEKRFPEMQRTYVRLADGVYTGGNLFLVNPSTLETSLPRIEHFFKLRKSPFRLAAYLGLPFILRFLTRSLSVADLEKKVSVMLSIRVKAVFSQSPEIGTDVDKLSDLALARNMLK